MAEELYAKRVLVRGSDGLLDIRYIDLKTGKPIPFGKLSKYEVISGSKAPYYGDDYKPGGKKGEEEEKTEEEDSAPDEMHGQLGINNGEDFSGVIGTDSWPQVKTLLTGAPGAVTSTLSKLNPFNALKTTTPTANPPVPSAEIPNTDTTSISTDDSVVDAPTDYGYVSDQNRDRQLSTVAPTNTGFANDDDTYSSLNTEPTPVSVVEAGKGFTTFEMSDGSVVTRQGDFGWRNNNPGNIEDGPFAAKQPGYIEDAGRFAAFRTIEEGNAARANLMFESPNYKDLTLAEAISRYAPPTENDTNGYISSIEKSTGISRDTKMSDLTPEQRQAVMNSQSEIEGNKVGQTIEVKAPTIDISKQGFPAPQIMSEDEAVGKINDTVSNVVRDSWAVDEGNTIAATAPNMPTDIAVGFGDQVQTDETAAAPVTGFNMEQIEDTINMAVTNPANAEETSWSVDMGMDIASTPPTVDTTNTNESSTAGITTGTPTIGETSVTPSETTTNTGFADIDTVGEVTPSTDTTTSVTASPSPSVTTPSTTTGETETSPDTDGDGVPDPETDTTGINGWDGW